MSIAPAFPKRLLSAVRKRGAIAFVVGATIAIASVPRAFGQTLIDDPSLPATESTMLEGESPVDRSAGVNAAWPADPLSDPEHYLPPHGQDPRGNFFGGPSVPHVQDEYAGPGWSPKSLWPPTYCLHGLRWFGLRHSRTHGRDVGLGAPLIGTSWLNRPYYVGAELGAIWIMRSQDDHVSRDTDVFGGAFFGWDWDHYWGSELRFDWATPELINSAQPDADRTDSLFTWSASFMYYPWGDSKIRPYWRWGVGSTHFDFPTDDGTRRDEWLLTLPLGVGVKYPIRRWLAARTEFTDQFSIGSDGLPTQHNLTLTFGFECHYGVHPKSYWPWNPSRHIW